MHDRWANQTPDVNVNIIRAFEGPRHSRLEFIWQVIAEYARRKINLHVFANPGSKLRHAECLNAIWKEELKRPEPYALLTEFDFLPNLWGWLPTVTLSERTPILAAEYCTRDPQTLELKSHNIPGAWYILLDKCQVGPDINFEGKDSKFKDPANDLHKQVFNKTNGIGVACMPQRDCMPAHYGTGMVTGTHLFWSRHLHDDPNTVVAGVRLGDVQLKHDEAVRQWLDEAPPLFRQLFRRRLKGLKLA